jgi:hypothetical protein
MLEVLLVAGAVAVAFLLTNTLVKHFWGIPLLCHLGLHRWQRELAGRGRDAQYVVKCRHCELLKDES